MLNLRVSTFTIDRLLPYGVPRRYHFIPIFKLDQDGIHSAAGDDPARLSFSFRQSGLPKPDIGEHRQNVFVSGTTFLLRTRSSLANRS